MVAGERSGSAPVRCASEMIRRASAISIAACSLYPLAALAGIDQIGLVLLAAVVVGGTSLLGGRGSVVQTLLGAIFIGVLNNGLNLRGTDPYLQKIWLGAVILLAVLFDRTNKK